ncbi:hypothetical protein [Paraburkholderia azotifigens]|uniref:Uncharacterized protein n=1 Tax=Paraburkholderia azotifigens TaxID=2057004 RepID=A0ABU9REE0_9BURK|nr:hypothetical protein [Paraburkholderia azotifigens]
MSKETAINGPLQLATIYRAGLGAQWNSYRDAAERFSAIYERPVGFARIREAVAVSELPPEVLSLFVDVGLVNGTARCLLKLARAEGGEVLCQRAEAIRREGLTVHGAPGNRSGSVSRRVVSFRWLGDNAVYVDRGGETSPPYRHLADRLTPGDPLPEEEFAFVV